MLAVRRPGWCINSTLPTIEIGNDPGGASRGGHQPQHDGFIRRVGIGVNIFRKRNEDNPFSIWGNMWEPVVKLIKGDLLLVRSIRLHSQYLHSSGRVSIIINISSIRRIFRAVYMTSRVESQLNFLASFHRHLIDIVYGAAIALGNIGN